MEGAIISVIVMMVIVNGAPVPTPRVGTRPNGSPVRTGILVRVTYGRP